MESDQTCQGQDGDGSRRDIDRPSDRMERTLTQLSAGLYVRVCV